MELGAILVAGSALATASDLRSQDGQQRRSSRVESSIARWNLVGPSVLRRTINLLSQKASVISVIDDGHAIRPHRSSVAWENAALNYARNGVERLLVVELGSYMEVDVADLLRFHLEKSSPITEVMSRNEKVGVAVIESKFLTKGNSFAQQLPAFLACSSSYEFSGYIHPLGSPDDYRKLAHSALGGRCGIKPDGSEVSSGIWVGRGARIAKSARLVAPCYVGAGTKVRSGALISGSAIEEHCEIDCGTVVYHSAVLPGTYVGPGLRLMQSIVNGTKLMHLGRNVEIDLDQTGLLGCTARRVVRDFVAGLNALHPPAENYELGRSTSSRPLASLHCVRGWFVE